MDPNIIQGGTDGLSNDGNTITPLITLEQISTFNPLTVILTFLTCSFIFIIQIICFIVLKKKYPQLYRLKVGGKKKYTTSQKIHPQKFYKTLFFSNKKIYEKFGLDTLVLIESVRSVVFISFCCLLLNIFIVIPLNYTSNQYMKNRMNLSYFFKVISISNVPYNSQFLWGHFIMVYVFSIIGFSVIYYNWKKLLFWKQQDFIDNPISSYIALIKDLPPSATTSVSKCKEYIHQLLRLDEKQISIYAMKDSFEIIKKIKELDQTLLELVVLLDYEGHSLSKEESCTLSNLELENQGKCKLKTLRTILNVKPSPYTTKRTETTGSYCLKNEKNGTKRPRFNSCTTINTGKADETQESFDTNDKSTLIDTVDEQKNWSSLSPTTATNLSMIIRSIGQSQEDNFNPLESIAPTIIKNNEEPLIPIEFSAPLTNDPQVQGDSDVNQTISRKVSENTNGIMEVSLKNDHSKSHENLPTFTSTIKVTSDKKTGDSYLTNKNKNDENKSKIYIVNPPQNEGLCSEAREKTFFQKFQPETSHMNNSSPTNLINTEQDVESLRKMMQAVAEAALRCNDNYESLPCEPPIYRKDFLLDENIETEQSKLYRTGTYLDEKTFSDSTIKLPRKSLSPYIDEKSDQERYKIKKNKKNQSDEILIQNDLALSSKFGRLINITEFENCQNKLIEYLCLRRELIKMKDGLKCIPSAVVVFSDSFYPTSLVRMRLSSHKSSMGKCIPPVDPAGVFYCNLKKSKFAKKNSKFFSILLTAVFIFFWSIPFGLVSSLTKSLIIADQYNIFKNIDPNIKAVIQTAVSSLIPMTILMIFYLALPFIFKSLSKLEGHATKAEIHMSMFTKFCCFYLINTFFVFIVSGSFLQEISDIIKQPFTLFEVLATTIPVQSDFFSIYLIFFALIVFPFYLICGSNLVKYLLRRKTRKNRFYWNVILCPKDPRYYYHYSQLIKLFGIGFSLSLFSPILTFFWTFCMISMYVIFFYLEVHYNKSKFSYKGQFFKKVADWLIVYIVIFQGLTAGVISLRGGVLQSAIIIPLPILTVLLHIYYRKYMVDKYDNISYETSIRCGHLSSIMRKKIIESFSIEKNIPDQFQISTFTIPLSYSHNVGRSYVKL